MMNFTCERPYAFYFLLFLIPSFLISLFQYRKIVKKIKFFSIINENDSRFHRMKQFPVIMVFRSIFRNLAWIMLVLAYAGLSWGTYLEPVNKSGSSAVFVFDISYSMMAKDAQGGMTRLKASSSYASMLLSHMENTSVSVVLAKGDGVNVIPLTEDKAVVESLLDSLSPSLMSTGGTSLGKGIRAALKAFPAQSSRLSTIWVFTDGEETDGLLEGALSDALRSGISVCIIGFGSEREVQVLAGDGKTFVNTALRSQEMRKTCENASLRAFSSGNSPVRAYFVNSAEKGSAVKVLETIKGNKISEDSDETAYLTYEVKPIQRYTLFLSLALLFVVLSFLITELDAERISDRTRRLKKEKNKSKKAGKLVSSSLIVFSLFLSSCSNHFEHSKTILESSWSWYQHKYNIATAGFLQTFYDSQEEDDFVIEQYALYNLGTTYLMQNEYEAALYKFAQISEEAPSNVRFASCYNTGIIAFRQGEYDSAIQCFRSALKIDGSKTNAKVNLELAIMKQKKDGKTKQSSVSPVSESGGISAMEDAVFKRIRENDMKQWKNSESGAGVSGSSDF